jgi:glycosyltransferase involved in cell wall biosynthesis
MSTSENTESRGVSVVVPVYNSAGTLNQLIERLQPVLQSIGEEFEAVLVNDGSRDGSWEVIESLAAQRPWVRGICMMRNYGQHNALLCGIRHARYPITLTIDDDLQHPPEEIPKLLAKLEEGFDVVFGTPEREQHGLWRDLASVITKIVLQKAMGAQTARRVGAFRALRTDLRRAFAEYRSPYVSIDVLLTWGTTRFAHLPVRHDPRTVGKSNYTMRKLMAHALNMMTGFSIVPLQLATITGFAFSVFGIGVLCYVLARYLFLGSTVAGFPFLASLVSIFSGAQMFALGIIGEYLARIHLRSMERPSYAVKDATSSAGAAAAAATGGTRQEVTTNA